MLYIVIWERKIINKWRKDHPKHSLTKDQCDTFWKPPPQIRDNMAQHKPVHHCNIITNLCIIFVKARSSKAKLFSNFGIRKWQLYIVINISNCSFPFPSSSNVAFIPCSSTSSHVSCRELSNAVTPKLTNFTSLFVKNHELWSTENTLPKDSLNNYF